MQQSNRLYLNVPYAEKDAARELGARWDAKLKKWFVPSGIEPVAFAKWFVSNPESPPAPTQQPQTTAPKLTIELVPQTCWYTNVRSEVSPEQWDMLRQKTYQQAKYQCEVCGGKGDRHPVECHEIWHYDDLNRVQTLKGLIALCPACHECKHIGYATTQGRGDIAAKHLAKVNGWSDREADLYIERCFEIWSERSRFEWRLDISYLDRLSPAQTTTRKGSIP